jgi:hypothetical protein
MKTLKLTLIVPLLLIAISCKKSSNNTNANGSISTDVAVDMAVGAISVNSFGFASVADNVSANAQTVSSVNGGGPVVNSTGTNAIIHQACGTTIADSLSFNGSTSSFTVNALYKFKRTLNCDGGQPDNLVNAITFSGSFDGPRLSSTDSGTSAVTIGGLANTATDFKINGVYTRTGFFTSKVGDKASGNSTVVINATNILLSKPGRAIASGSALISVSGSVPAGSFNFSGTLVFKGENQATLTIGTTIYLVNLLTGTYTKQ